jgi:adenylate cyclase
VDRTLKVTAGSDGAARFLPRHLRTHAPAFAIGTIEPASHDIDGVALVADISGFTALTDRMSREGPGGLARLSAELNRVLGSMSAIIAEHGGDEDSTAGDSILALWNAAPGSAIADSAAAACACAQALLGALDDSVGESGISLRMRVAIVSGRMRIMHLGGSGGRWLHVLSGAPLFGVATLLDLTPPGAISLDHATRAALGRAVDAVPMAEEGFRVTAARINRPTNTAETIPPLSDAEEQALLPFVHPSVRGRHEGGPASWTAEIRTINTLFLGLTGIEPASDGNILVIQRVVAEIQSVLARFDTHIHALSMHDKGPMVMAVFGLPGHTHADDAFRAIRGAREVQLALDRLWLDSTCGIATGRAYCGPAGSGERLTFSVIGDVVNRASRLQSSGRFRIQCDEATVAAVGERVRFERMGTTTLKGVADSIAIYCPRVEVDPPPMPSSQSGLRNRDLDEIIGALNLAEAPGSGLAKVGLRMLALRGEAGMGKTTLLQQLSDHVGLKGRSSFSGRTDPYNREVPFLCWRSIFGRLFDLDPTVDPAAAMAGVVNRIEEVPGLAMRAPLFNSVLPFVIPDTSVTLAMQGAARFDSTIEALADFLWHALAQSPALVVLDDVQWLDTASAALLRAFVGRDQRGTSRGGIDVAVVLAGRPGPDMDRAFTDIGGLAGTLPLSEIQLLALDDDVTGGLVATTVGAAKAETALARFVHSKTGGNPFFVRELALALLAAGAISLSDGQVHAPAGIQALAAAGFPDSVERTVLARFDKLPPGQKTILKCGSVIGTTFNQTLLEDLIGGAGAGSSLQDDLAELVRKRLLVRAEGLRDEGEYAFDHIIAQETIYGLLLPADASEMHHRIARWLAAHAESADPAIVAGHFDRAGAFAEAADAYERSGLALLRSGTNSDSILQLKRAIDCIEKSGMTGQGLRRARLHRHLGEACNRLGRLADAQTNLEAGLSLLGRPWPASKVGVARAVVSGFAAQFIGSRIARRRPRQPAAVVRAAERAVTYLHLAHTHYFCNRDTEIILAVVEQVNHAEVAGDVQLTANGYLQISNVLGILGLHRAADRYQQHFAPLRPRLDPVTLAHCNELQSLYLASVGRLAECRALLEEALEIAERIGDNRFRREFLSLLGIVTLPLGLPDLSRKARAGFQTLARASSDQQALLWSLVEAAEIALHVGDHETVDTSLAEAVPLLQRFGAGETIWANGIRARSLADRAQIDLALDLATQTLSVIRKTMPVSYYTLEGYAGVVETFLRALEDGDMEPRARARLLRDAAAAIKGLGRFARPFRIARPRLFTLRSRLSDCAGRADGPALASRAFEEAERLSLPLEALHARTLLAGYLPQGEAVPVLVEIDRAYADLQAASGRADLRRMALRRGIVLSDGLPGFGNVNLTRDMPGEP